MKFFLGVYGHTVLDHIITVPRLPPPNTSIETVDRQVFFGGTGANIARIASTLGVGNIILFFCFFNCFIKIINNSIFTIIIRSLNSFFYISLSTATYFLLFILLN